MSDERRDRESDRDLIIRRILVALDASPHSQAALEAAAELAARFQAELSGLFVEDINLLRLMDLPFAREVGFFSATRRQLSSRDLERQLRAQASRVRQRITAVAERARLQWSFRVTRGTITSELLTAAAEADLVILGRTGLSPTRRRGLGSTARAIAHRAPAMTLLLQASTCLGPPVVVLYDGSVAAQRALVAGAALVAATIGEESAARLQVQDRLTVVLVDGSEQAASLRSEAARHLAGYGIRLRYLALTTSNIATLVQLLHAEQCGTLVVPIRGALLQEESVLELLDEIDIPVLLVR